MSKKLICQVPHSSYPYEIEIGEELLNLETAVQDDKVMQDFDSESLSIGVEHSQKVKATSVGNDYGSKDCVNLPSSTAVSRIIEDSKAWMPSKLKTNF